MHVIFFYDHTYRQHIIKLLEAFIPTLTTLHSHNILMFEYTKNRIRYQNTFELAISNIMFEVVRLVFHLEGILQESLKLF